MKIEVNINKKYAFMILGAIVILAGAIFVYAQSTPNPGHSASQVSPGTFQSGNWRFDGGIGINRNPAPGFDLIGTGKVRGDELCIGTDCRSSWPSGGSGGGLDIVSGTYNGDGTSSKGINLGFVPERVEIYKSIPGGESGFSVWFLKTKDMDSVDQWANLHSGGSSSDGFAVDISTQGFIVRRGANDISAGYYYVAYR